VLADTALRAKDLDEAAALAAKQRAEDALRGAPTSSNRPKLSRSWCA
jgi:F0F1-type ATP synthase epsilon subunit